jgi:hypothetical protein
MSQSDLMKRIDQIKEISAAIGENPDEYAKKTFLLAGLGAILYSADDTDEELNGFVNSVKDTAVRTNDRLKKRGINIATQTYTVTESNLGAIAMKFGGAISEENVSLTADNLFDFQFNYSIGMSAQFGMGVNVPLGPGSFKPNFGYMTLVNMGWKMGLNIRFYGRIR